MTSQFVFAADFKRDAEQALEMGIKYFKSISPDGGYVWYVTPDLTQRWGEGIVDEKTIEVQPPGTPSVGMAFLKAYEATRYATALRAAQSAATALIRGQNDLGGWGHVIKLDGDKSKIVSFDDDQTQSAISFLMALDHKVGSDELWAAIEKSLNMMVASQLPNGGWPHQYPKQGNYHDYATFNDEGMNDCIRVMIEADNFYSNPQFKRTLNRAALFLMRSQLSPPQSGWAQQYNEFLQPAWARSFEPPSVCPAATLNNINSLMDLGVQLNNRDWLEPIHDSLRWLDEVRLPNGLWARFIELGTGEPLYYDRGRIRVNSTSELSEERRLGYGYETDLSEKLEKARKRFKSLWIDGKEIDAGKAGDTEARFSELEGKVREVIAAQDKKGRWITKDDKFKKQIPGQSWNGEWEVKDRVSSRVFINNIEILSEYLDLFRRKLKGEI